MDSMHTAMKILSLEGIGIAEKAAGVIDGDSFEKLAISLDIEDPFYENTRLRLLGIKGDTNCRFLFTMAPAHGSI
jgi:methyl-accepting chemotaxis protein